MNLKFIWIKCEDCVTFKTALKPVSTGELYCTICPMSKFSPLSSTRPGVGYHKRKRYFFSWEELDWGQQKFVVLGGWQVGIAESNLFSRAVNCTNSLFFLLKRFNIVWQDNPATSSIPRYIFHWRSQLAGVWLLITNNIWTVECWWLQ